MAEPAPTNANAVAVVTPDPAFAARGSRARFVESGLVTSPPGAVSLRSGRGRTPLECAREPVRRVLRGLLERPRLLEEMGGARHDDQLRP